MKSHHCPLTHQQRKRKRLPSTLKSLKDTWHPEEKKPESQSQCTKRSEILQTARKIPREFNSQARSKRLKLSSGGN
ncbi:hypothetical protein PIB30_109243, partial [Stylosanthes scabra]|nr:hypothetical protein [Stylosanthes scabra]